MASNSNCEAVLSCGDSALSITGNIIGILTFSYALIITVLYRTRALGNADQDIQYFGRQIEREIRSFKSSIKWMQSLHEADDKPLEIWDAASSLVQEAEGMLQEAERIFQESEKLFRPTMDGNYPKWRLLFEKGRFLSRKTEIQKYLGDILQIRSIVEGKSQELASRVQRQSEAFDNHLAIMEHQKAMLRRVMNSLHLDAMEEPPGEGLILNGIPNRLKMVDMNMEMRPVTQWDPPGPQNGDP
ncbi:hypothetical protein N7451_000560 [Penicillium sp. IBT 35674x]|nr:hypothetical protein N7451_000560 [Penicillium sp. IBT 35674x]